MAVRLLEIAIKKVAKEVKSCMRSYFLSQNMRRKSVLLIEKFFDERERAANGQLGEQMIKAAEARPEKD